MENLEHKQEILDTRIGNLGSSDAAMVARLGKDKPSVAQLNRSDARRLAVVVGKAQPLQIRCLNFAKGDAGEMVVYNHLYENCLQVNETITSNPLHKWAAYYGNKNADYGNFGCIDHIDAEIAANGLVTEFIEIKTSGHTLQELLDEYRYQLAWHSLALADLNKMGQAAADAKLMLYRYPIDDIEWVGGIDDGYIANPNPALIELCEVSIQSLAAERAEILAGLEWLMGFLPTFEYVEPDEYDAEELGDEIGATFCNLEALNNEIRRLTEEADVERVKILQFMQSTNIGTVRTPLCTFSAVKAKTTSRFDSKKFKADHPELYNQYQMEVTTSAQLQVRQRKD